jgi:anti-sigma B factor antagonist
MTNLTVATHTTTRGHILTIRGSLDMTSSPTLRQSCEQLTYVPGQEVVLDLAGLVFCDSSGISTFIAARNHAATFGATLALAAPPARVTKMFATIGLSEFFVLYDTVDQAQH